MRQRFLLAAAMVFFLTMNALLLRSEFGARSDVGDTVPVGIVWDKILNAPDNSLLEIRQRGAKIGRLTWFANVGEARRGAKTINDEPRPEGMVHSPTGYTLECDATLTLDDLTRARLTASLELSTNQTWREFDVALKIRPLLWEYRANAAMETVTRVVDDGSGRKETKLTFAEFAQPRKLLQEFGGAAGLPAWLNAALPGIRLNATPAALGLRWEAHRTRLKAGHVMLPVYRLRLKLIEGLHLTVYVGTAGEIYRVELPEDLVLINDVLLAI